MNQWHSYTLKTASSILTMVSIVLTVLLWSSLPDPAWLKFVAGLAGFALELCKFVMLPLAFLYLYGKDLAKGVPLLAIGIALFAVSIGASVMFLETGQQSREKQSSAWAERQETLRQLDEKIRIGQDSASQDAASSYGQIRQRALDTLEDVEQWQQERAALISQPIELQGAMPFSRDKRFYAWLLLALLIDGCAVAGWTLLNSSNKTEAIEQNNINLPEETYIYEPEQLNKITEEETERNQQNELQLNDDHEQKQQEKGRLTIRGIMATEKVGYQKAKAIYDRATRDIIPYQP